MTLVRIVAPHFVAAVVADSVVRECAPILSYMTGWNGLLAYAHPVYGYPSTVTEYRCTDPQTNQRYAARTWWGCPVTQAYPEVLYPWWTLITTAPPNVSMMVASVSPATLTLTFDGVPVVMSLAQSIQSPAPYTCAQSALRFRVFGR